MCGLDDDPALVAQRVPRMVVGVVVVVTGSPEDSGYRDMDAGI
jgi:hypothetical protein